MIIKLLGLMFSLAVASSSLLDGLEKPEVREVKMRLEEEKAKRLLLQNDVEMLMLKFEQLARTCKGDPIGTTGKVGENVIAFTARLSAQTAFAEKQVIKFDHVTYNHGNGYSPRTGVFRAPMAGTFVISVTLQYIAGENAHGMIYKNNAEIGRVYADRSNSWAGTGSVTVVTWLEEDDEVYVREFFRGTTLAGDYWSSFTGFKI